MSQYWSINLWLLSVAVRLISNVCVCVCMQNKSEKLYRINHADNNDIIAIVMQKNFNYYFTTHFFDDEDESRVVKIYFYVNLNDFQLPFSESSFSEPRPGSIKKNRLGSHNFLVKSAISFFSKIARVNNFMAFLIFTLCECVCVTKICFYYLFRVFCAVILEILINNFIEVHLAIN